MLPRAIFIVKCMKRVSFFHIYITLDVYVEHMLADSPLKFITLPFCSDMKIRNWSRYECFKGLYSVLCIPLLQPLSRVKQSNIFTNLFPKLVNIPLSTGW